MKYAILNLMSLAKMQVMMNYNPKSIVTVLYKRYLCVVYSIFWLFYLKKENEAHGPHPLPEKRF